ncbi:MAG TPA: cobalamin-binding protein [Thermotogae bacterium]|nr:cobalamin-binding protein [Thermotogota bacterium]
MVRKISILLLLMAIVTVSFSFPITLIDDLGRPVTITEEPERVVVAAPAVTDFLVKLGVEEKIVGVTDFDPYQREGIERIGNMVPLNLEKIVSLRPDLVFLTGGFQEPEISKLEAINVKCMVINPQSVNDILKDVVLIGSAVGRSEKAKRIYQSYRDRFLQIAKKAYTIPQENRLKVFYGMPDENFSQIWTCGSGSYMNEIIVYAGGVNVAAGYSGNNGWLPVGPEFVIKANPDVILIPFWYEGGEKEAVEHVLNFKPWKEVSAVKNGRVYAIDGNVASNPNLEIFELLERIYTLLYEE